MDAIRESAAAGGFGNANPTSQQARGPTPNAQSIRELALDRSQLGILRMIRNKSMNLYTLECQMVTKGATVGFIAQNDNGNLFFAASKFTHLMERLGIAKITWPVGLRGKQEADATRIELTPKGRAWLAWQLYKRKPNSLEMRGIPSPQSEGLSRPETAILELLRGDSEHELRDIAENAVNVTDMGHEDARKTIDGLKEKGHLAFDDRNYKIRITKSGLSEINWMWQS